MRAAIILLACLALSGCDETKSGNTKADDYQWNRIEMHMDCRWSAKLASCMCIYRDIDYLNDRDALGVTIVPAKVCGR